jgi:xanthine dehydrogenase YagR molybdenum-binding subunit
VRTIDYFGEIIAIVVAESFEVARDAAKRLKVEYETLDDGAFDYEANKDKAEPAPDGANQGPLRPGRFRQGVRECGGQARSTYTTPSQNSAAMEPHASIAVWEDGALTLYGAYQMPTSTRNSSPSHWAYRNPRYGSSRYIGGGFGSKLGIAPESVAAAIAAKRLNRPVKAVMLRQQVFDATVRRSNTEQRMRLGAEAGGRIVALGHEAITSNLPDEDFFEPVGIGTHFLYAGRIGGSTMTWCG